LSDFITNGASVLPAVKSDVRVPTGSVGEWAADDSNQLRQAALDLRSQAILEASTRAAADAAIIASGATPANVGLAPILADGTTAYRTSNERWADVVNVKDFGAVGNGSTDDTAAIQAAVDASPVGATVFFPVGTYKTTAAIRLKSYRSYRGAGRQKSEYSTGYGSVVRRDGTAGLVFDLYAVADYCNSVSAEYLTVDEGVTGCTAFGHSIALTVLDRLVLRFIDDKTSKGIQVASTGYAQGCHVSDYAWSGTTINQCIRFCGNHNTFDRLTKNGQTDSDTTSLFQFTQHVNGVSQKLTIRDLLVQQSMAGNRHALDIASTGDVTLEDTWFEYTGTDDGYIAQFSSVQGLRIRGGFYGMSPTKQVKLTSCTPIEFETLSANSDDWDSEALFDMDSVSSIHAIQLQSRKNAHQKLDSAHKFKVGSQQNWNLYASPVAGISPNVRWSTLSGQNLLINPSFEQDDYAWDVSAIATPTYVASGNGPGKMLKFDIAPGGWHGSLQGPSQNPALTISAAQAGRPMTFTARARLYGTGGTNPQVTLRVITGATDSFSSTSAGETDGWSQLSVTIIPETGALTIGVFAIANAGSYTVEVDDVCLNYGAEPITNPAKFGSIDLTGGGAIFSGAGAPGFVAPKGTMYLRTDGGAGTTLYINEAGTNTWVGK
jgi:hypothetical protein